MSSYLPIDSVIDDDDEFCPLCIEEFDLSDKNFKPCPCGYQICQFCYNNIKTHSDEGKCPNCRRVYDESTIQYKVPDADEFKADLALKHRKAAAAKKKESEKREIEASSRKNLAGVRVVQKNLVYVIGLNPTIRDENQLLQTLRGRDYFGQYGDIDKIVVSKAKPGGNSNHGIGVYVTFSKRADAATCIAAVDGSLNGDRVLRAQFGTTKYCSSFLRNEQCHNRNCTFLHETGEDSESFSRQDLSSINTSTAQRHGHSNGASGVPSHGAYSHQPHTRYSAQPVSSPMRRQPSKDDTASRGQGISDGPALPSSASWANKDAPINRARRSSFANSQTSQSPRPQAAAIASGDDDPKLSERNLAQTLSRRQTPSPAEAGLSTQQSAFKATKPFETENPLDNLLKAVNSPDFKFVFSTSNLPADEAALVENHPSFIDPYGGVKRRAMRKKAEQERAKREQEILQSVTAEEETRESGSLQLGGEPDDIHPARGRSGRETVGTIQPPSQQGTAASSAIGSPVSATSHQFQGLNIGARSLTPLQQQQLMLLKSANSQQAAGLVDPIQTNPNSAAFDQAAQLRQGLLQSQMAQFNALQAQNRQPSRFSFANDAGAKNVSNARMLGQQASLMQAGTPNPLSAPSPQHGLTNTFYTSGVQGPPPGLKTTGTPPISGGGMFAQGHGFTTNANMGFGSNVGKQEANPDLMREFLRGRSGASGLQGQEAAKREFMFPFLQQHQTPPPLAPTNGLLSSFYGSQAGTFSEVGPQKQKKKGKKHRHANTSSGGGGVVDLADPSILQARMHQVGANAAAGQALYGSQGQVDEEFPPLGTQPRDRRTDSLGFPFRSHLHTESHGSSVRSGTPTLPPGLPVPHVHPSSHLLQDALGPSSPSPSVSIPPSVQSPVLPPGPPAQKAEENIADQQTPELKIHLEDVPPSDRVKNASEVSLGSPVPKSAGKGREPFKNELSVTTEKKDGPSSIEDASGQDKVSVAAKPKPAKLSRPDSVSQLQVASSPKAEDTTHNLSGSALTTGSNSRPNTPMTGVSRVSDSSLPRQHRVLRVIDTSKTGTPPPPSSTTQSVSSVQVKKHSRRPSLSSLSRPDTPGDFGSEGAPSYTSASASRANSPPPSRIGSAPVRAVSKSQAKKDRRQKAKDAEAKKHEVATALVEEPVQAPIVGRKRKAKKTPSNNVEPSSVATDSKSTSNVEEAEVQKPEVNRKSKSKDKPQKGAEGSPVEEKQATGQNAPAEVWRSDNTVERMLNDSESSGIPLKNLFMERSSPLPVLLAELHKSGDIDLNNHPLFNPPNLGQRVDLRCSADDYETLKHPVELNEEHRKALLRGDPIRISGGPDQHKNRFLISPRGCILRYLSAEEEDRYLTLERSVGKDLDLFQDYPIESITEPDMTNRGGGLDALFATPENFNICWMDEASLGLAPTSPNVSLSTTELSISSMPSVPPNILSAMEADSTRSHHWAIANTAELVNATAASVRSFAAATAKHMLGAAGVVMGPVPDLDDVIGMTDDELRSFALKSQKELEGSRKEIDVVDKKLSALVKRNKKLVQQALSTVVEG